MKVVLFAAASLIAILSGALAGALTREPLPVEAGRDCVGAECASPVPSPSVAPTLDAPCDEPAEALDPACGFVDADEDDDDDDDGDNSGPGDGGSSGPG